MKCTLRYTFIAFTSAIILSGCGGGKSSVETTFSSTAALNTEGPISTGERNVATRICYAYQSKSKNFRGSDFLGTNFTFSAKKIDCQNTTKTYQINATLKYDDNNNLIYQTPSTIDPNLKFVKKVQTDSSGYLSQLCTKIQNNEVINNTITDVTTGTKVQITFIREGLDGFFLQYFKKQTDNSYKIDSAEKLKVRTQIDYKNGQILGMDESYSNQKICNSQFDVNKYSDYTQTFISR